MKNLQVSLEQTQHQRLKHVAADVGKTLAVLIREAVGMLIEQHEKTRELSRRDGR